MLVAAVVAIPILVFLLVGPKLLAPNNRPPVAVSTSSEPVMTAPPTPRKTARIAPTEPTDMPATDGGLSQPEPSAAEQQPQEPAAGVVVTQSILPPSEDDPSTVALPSAPVPNTAPSPVDATTALPTPPLDLGQIEDAKLVQRRLVDLGFLFGAADGNWGPRSRKALRDFRAAQHIGANDTWDEEAQEALFSTTAVRAPTTATFVGGWGLDADQCRQVHDNRSPLTISTRSAEAFGATCQFNVTERQSANEWRIRATCADERDRWNANIRLTLSGNKLTWTSERGTVTYLRCPVIWN
jgi:peptidoglycan hydrolase-like protein with peptidoglycan-binding domain